MESATPEEDAVALKASGEETGCKYCESVYSDPPHFWESHLSKVNISIKKKLVSMAVIPFLYLRIC